MVPLRRKPKASMLFRLFTKAAVFIAFVQSLPNVSPTPGVSMMVTHLPSEPNQLPVIQEVELVSELKESPTANSKMSCPSSSLRLEHEPF